MTKQGWVEEQHSRQADASDESYSCINATTESTSITRGRMRCSTTSYLIKTETAIIVNQKSFLKIAFKCASHTVLSAYTSPMKVGSAQEHCRVAKLLPVAKKAVSVIVAISREFGAQNHSAQIQNESPAEPNNDLVVYVGTKGKLRVDSVLLSRRRRRQKAIIPALHRGSAAARAGFGRDGGGAQRGAPVFVEVDQNAPAADRQAEQGGARRLRGPPQLLLRLLRVLEPGPTSGAVSDRIAAPATASRRCPDQAASRTIPVDGDRQRRTH